jgi:hypothetical protein
MSEQPATSSAPPTSAPAKRGVLYIKWGNKDAALQRSINSLRAFHPELPVHVHQLPDTATFLDKAAMMNFTPFEETLYLDVDTVVLNRLDFGFEMAVRHGLACSICECPWARRYGGIDGDIVDYNTGVLFFTNKARPIFDDWNEKVRVVDSSIRFYDEKNQLAVMPCADQAGFALAVANAATLPFILPMNWNFRPHWHRSWWGPINIWHDYSPQAVVDFTKAQAQPNAVIQYRWART